MSPDLIRVDLEPEGLDDNIELQKLRHLLKKFEMTGWDVKLGDGSMKIYFGGPWTE